MSYCRMSDTSDVYVYGSEKGYVCSWCELDGKYDNDSDGTIFQTPQDIVNHLLEHRKIGNQVPQYAIDTLQSEIDDGTGN